VLLSRKRVSGSSARAGAGAVVPMASTELRMAMNFFMVSLLGFFHGSTSAAWEERTASRFIPKKIIYFQMLTSEYRQNRKRHPKLRSGWLATG
jgi:hypothetical protein